MLDVKVIRIAYRADGLTVEARTKVLQLPGRTLLDSYSFAVHPTEESQASDDERFKRAYREVARAAIDRSMLVYRGESEMLRSAQPAAIDGVIETGQVLFSACPSSHMPATPLC